MHGKQWTARRAFDLRLAQAAKNAVEAIEKCGDDAAVARFLRLLADRLDDRKSLPGSNGPPRAA